MTSTSTSIPTLIPRRASALWLLASATALTPLASRAGTDADAPPVVIAQALGAGPVTEPLPLTGPAWTLADAAYRAYASGDYALAARQAREALRLRPDVPRLQALLRQAEAARDRRAGTQPASTQAARNQAARAGADPVRAARSQPPGRQARLKASGGTTPPAGTVTVPATSASSPGAPGQPPALVAAERSNTRPGAPQSLPSSPSPPQPPPPPPSPSPPSPQHSPPQPSEAASSPVPSPAYRAAEAAYAAQARGDLAAAADRAREAARLAPDNADYRRLLGDAEAASAYAAVRQGEDRQALAAFNRADAAGGLPNTAWQDAAHAAVRAGEDRQAVAYFERVIDDAGALRLAMSPQLLFNTRRAVAEVSRRTGAIVSLSSRGAVPGLGLSPGAAAGASGASVQAGAEVWWRPGGWRNGRYVELFARAFETLYQPGGRTGTSTVQSALGVRYKPFTDTNAVVSLSRVFAPSGGRDDWLGQLAWSGGEGDDLRVDVPQWWTTRLSAEAGRYLDSGHTYALAQAQAGRSFRVGDADGRWVLYPHLALAADHDSQAVQPDSAGFGPGISARYWFREDTFNAPRSYLDITLQYRVRIAGAQRARGVFLNTTLMY